MNLQSIDVPRATHVLNSMAMELGALETATERLRAQFDTLLAMLAVDRSVENDAEEGELQSSASLPVEEDVFAAIVPEGAEASQWDAAVIGLCARIEASVAELAAAAEVTGSTVEAVDAVELVLEAVAATDASEHEAEPAPVAATAAVVSDVADEVVVASEEPIMSEAEGVAAEAPSLAVVSDDEPVASGSEEVSQPLVAVSHETDAGAALIAANITVTDEDAIPAADSASPVNKVVVLEIKRRVWPQRLEACASVLLIAAAAVVVVVTMPEMMEFTI